MIKRRLNICAHTKQTDMVRKNKNIQPLMRNVCNKVSMLYLITNLKINKFQFSDEMIAKTMNYSTDYVKTFVKRLKG